MKKVMVITLFLMAVSVLVFASSEKAIEAKEAKTVEIFWHMTEYESWCRETMKPLFEAENPDIKLKYTFVNDPENEAVLSTRLAADNLPDIFACIGGPGIVALQEDKLLDISQIPELQENLSQYPESLFEFSRLVRKYAGLSPTGIYAAPTMNAPTGVFYDKNMFKKAGVTPVTTYDEWWKLLERLENSGLFRNAVAWGNHRWMVYNGFWQVATALIGPEVSSRILSGDVKLDSPKMIEVWDYFKRIADKGYADKEYMSREWGLLEADFANLKYGVILQGPWLFNSYPKINPEIELGVFPFPTKDGKNRHWIGFVGDRNWWVAKKPTESREAQIRVFNWMIGPEYADHMIRDVNLLPFYQKEYKVDSPVLTEMWNKGFPAAPQANFVMNLIIPSGNPGFYNFIWDNLTKLTNKGMSSEDFGKMVEDYYGQFRK